MTLIACSNLKPGMTITDAVSGPDGRVLIPANTPVEARHLVLLRAWGISEVPIGSPSRPQIDPRLVKEAESGARAAVGTADPTDPFIKELIRTCALRRLKGLLNGRGHAG